MSVRETALPTRPKAKPLGDDAAIAFGLTIIIGIGFCVAYLDWWAFGLIQNLLFILLGPIFLVARGYKQTLPLEKARRYNRIHLCFWAATLGSIFTLPLIAIQLAGLGSRLALGSQIMADLGVLLFALGSLLPRQPNLRHWRFRMVNWASLPILASNLLALFALKYG